MSLIHDALKKAHGEEFSNKGVVPIPKMVVVDEGGAKKVVNKKTLILAGVFLVVASYFVYDRVLKKESTQSAAAAKLSPNAALSSDGKGPQSSQELVQDEAARLGDAGTLAFKKGDFESAIGKYSAASQIDPKNSEVWNNLGLSFKKKGDHQKAREAYEKALSLKADYPEVLNNLAVLDIKSDNLAKAKANLQKALELKPNYPEASFHMAVICERENNIPEAVRYYKIFLSNSADASPAMIEQVKEHVFSIEP